MEKKICGMERSTLFKKCIVPALQTVCESQNINIIDAIQKLMNSICQVSAQQDYQDQEMAFDLSKEMTKKTFNLPSMNQVLQGNFKNAFNHGTTAQTPILPGVSPTNAQNINPNLVSGSTPQSQAKSLNGTVQIPLPMNHQSIPYPLFQPGFGEPLEPKAYSALKQVLGDQVDQLPPETLKNLALSYENG
jgi:hypothetical protein